MGRRGLAIVLFGSLLGACGPKSPREQIEGRGQSVASWAATAVMIGRTWLQGDVPTVYAQKTLRSAGTQVTSARTSLERSARGEPLALAAIDRYGRLARLLARMAAAVGTDDRAAVARLLAQLPEEAQSIRALRRQSQSGG